MPKTLTGVYLDAVAESIPTEFSASAGRVDLRELLPKGNFKKLMVINQTEEMVGIDSGELDDPVPDGSSGHYARCPANYSVTFEAEPESFLLLDYLYFKSESGSPISLAGIIVNLWS